jgi:hypothetical protein
MKVILSKVLVALISLNLIFSFQYQAFAANKYRTTIDDSANRSFSRSENDSLKKVMGDDYSEENVVAIIAIVGISAITALIYTLMTAGYAEAKELYVETKEKKDALLFAEKHPTSWCHHHSEWHKWEQDINNYLIDKLGSDVTLCSLE